MQIKLKIDGKENTFVTPDFVSGLVYRNILRLQAEGKFPSNDEENMNEVINLICETFDNKFTIEEFWNGTHAPDINKNITKFVAYVNGYDQDAESEKATNKRGKR